MGVRSCYGTASSVINLGSGVVRIVYCTCLKSWDGGLYTMFLSKGAKALLET